MSVRAVLAAAALLVAVAACNAVELDLPGGQVECGGTETALCDAVARLAVAQMNLTATGPITRVTLASGDCARFAASIFQVGLRTADQCWAVDVTGERSYGGGYVGLQPDGTLHAYWP